MATLTTHQVPLAIAIAITGLRFVIGAAIYTASSSDGSDPPPGAVAGTEQDADRGDSAATDDSSGQVVALVAGFGLITVWVMGGLVVLSRARRRHTADNEGGR